MAADGSRSSIASASPIPTTAFVPTSRLEARVREPAPKLEDELEARMQAELDAFADAEKRELGLSGVAQWRDVVNGEFTGAQRPHTTLLVSGLTYAHDAFITAGLRGLGYRVKALDTPDMEGLRLGKEFGNRGQCNPTYFTVGNLVKTLTHLRDSGISTQDIIDRYVYVTAGACGPCRFGSYTTEYRKALRDSGFDGFRVVLFQQKGGLDQKGEGDVGLVMNPAFFSRVLMGLMVGDVLNSLMYRIRPYEIEVGATDRALANCRALLVKTMETPGQMWRLPYTLVQVRRELAAVAVDRTRIKPKVGIIGEFWAMTTEGDGNYKMPAFLEQEGAEVDVQLVTAWLLYNLWEVRWDTQRRMALDGVDGGLWGLAGKSSPGRTVWTMHAADKALRVIFQGIANTMGLHGHTLPDMDELAEATKGLYHEEVRGGEGHMEVAKLILNTVHRKVNMTLSIKPFGCMPSSGVSDGVQSVVQRIHPDAIYLPIETTGDGAVNVHSRVQMMLFKARQQAEREVQTQLAEHGATLDEVRGFIGKNPWLQATLHRAPHLAGSTAGDVVAEAGKWLGRARKLRALVPALG